MPGEYTTEDLRKMTREELDAAAARGFMRLDPAGGPVTAFPVPAGAELTSATPEQIRVRSAASERPQAAAPNPNAWAERRSQTRDFTCPSGQTCRLRPLSPEKLLEAGLLDRVSRLEGLAADLVDKAEGQPPAKNKMPSREEIAALLEVLNTLMPIAVVEPRVYADDDKDAPEGAIRSSDIDLGDRMAIMEESLSGLRGLDRFRNA